MDASLIVRGIRTVKDFEYEETIADINRKLSGIETILLFTEPELTSVSSTVVRELLRFGKDVSLFLPEGMDDLRTQPRLGIKMEMMRKILSVCLLLYMRGARHSNQKTELHTLRKLQIAEFAIQQLYVDTVTKTSWSKRAIIEMLRQLDPHSTYDNAEEVKKINEPLQGNFEGIGVQFKMNEDTLIVIQPVPGGPSEKVGILAGDRIIAVNDSAIAGVKMSTDDIISRLRGPKGRKVNLAVCAVA